MGDGPGAAEEAARPYVDRVIQEIRSTAAAAAVWGRGVGTVGEEGILGASIVSRGGIGSNSIVTGGGGSGADGWGRVVGEGSGRGQGWGDRGQGRGQRGGEERGQGREHGEGGGQRPQSDEPEQGRGERRQDRGQGAGWGQGQDGVGLKTLFFGGGTPSLCPPELVGALMETVRECYGIAEGAEISIEMDPGTFDEVRSPYFRGKRAMCPRDPACKFCVFFWCTGCTCGWMPGEGGGGEGRGGVVHCDDAGSD